MMPHKNKRKGTLIYDGGAHASPSTITTNGALSAKGNNKDGVTNEAIAHEKIKVPSTSNIA